MNIYLVREDGEDFCIKAETIAGAYFLCLKSYIDEMQEEKKTIDMEEETKYYNENIMKSCELIGPLKNP